VSNWADDERFKNLVWRTFSSLPLRTVRNFDTRLTQN
jgi:hypothetical protein